MVTDQNKTILMISDLRWHLIGSDVLGGMKRQADIALSPKSSYICKVHVLLPVSELLHMLGYFFQFILTNTTLAENTILYKCVAYICKCY